MTIESGISLVNQHVVVKTRFLNDYIICDDDNSQARKEIKMYKLHWVLLINFLALVSFVFAAEECKKLR